MENVGGELLARVPGLSNNPRWQAGARAFSSVVLQPSNLIPLPEVGTLLKAGKLGRAVEAGGELASRVGRVVGLVDRGLVEASPLGLREGAESLMSSLARKGESESLDVFLRGPNGRNFLFNTRSHELVDLETGELLDVNHPDTAKLFSESGRDAPEMIRYKGRDIVRVPMPDRTVPALLSLDRQQLQTRGRVVSFRRRWC
jgi:hypothetical protein